MKRAYTLIELLIVISVLMILVGLSSLSIVSFGKASDVGISLQVVKSGFLEARSNSISDLDDKPWGVHLEGGKAIVYPDSGAGYNPSDPSNMTKLLSSNTLMTWTIEGGDDVLFTKRTAKTTNTGTITFTGSSPGGKTITINSEGLIESD